MLRSIAAVVAGLIVTTVLVMVLTFLAAAVLGVPQNAPPTPAYLLLNLLGSALAGGIGGATAVRIAPHTLHLHVGALAVLILLLSLPTLFSSPAPGQPTWYGLAIGVIGPSRWPRAASSRSAAGSGSVWPRERRLRLGARREVRVRLRGGFRRGDAHRRRRAGPREGAGGGMIWGPGFAGPTSQGLSLWVPKTHLEVARSLLEPEPDSSD